MVVAVEPIHHRSAYVTAPTVWDTGLVAQYAADTLRRRGAVPADFEAAVELTDSDQNADHTTTWRVRYRLVDRPSEPDRGRPLSLSGRL